jgi:hypothetical protein
MRVNACTTTYKRCYACDGIYTVSYQNRTNTLYCNPECARKAGKAGQRRYENDYQVTPELWESDVAQAA